MSPQVTPSASAQVAASLLRMVKVFTVLTLLVTATGFFGEEHRLLELTCHFRVQYLASARRMRRLPLLWGALAIQASLQQLLYADRTDVKGRQTAETH